MKRIPGLGRDTIRWRVPASMQLLSVAAAALLSLPVLAGGSAEALPLIHPGTAATHQVAGDLAIEVRGGHGGHGGFGGGVHGGGPAFHGGAFHTGPAFGGGWHGGHRFAHRHQFRRVFIGGVWYDYPYYNDYPYYYDYPPESVPPGCRIVLTGHGPQLICPSRSRRSHAHRHHHYRKHHRVDR